MPRPRNKEKEYNITRSEQLKLYPKGLKKGIRFTFFAAEGNYPRDPIFEHAFYSVYYLQKQVWREHEPHNAFDDVELRKKYKGQVPLKVLIDKLNDVLVGEEYDFKKVYKNWRYRYERGVFGPELRPDGIPVTHIIESVSDSRGNPPPNRDNQAW